jgi:uncharacterized phage protein (TIGR01671 family)
MTSNRFRFRAWDKSFQKYCENVIVSTINEEITVYERLVNGNTLLIPSAHVVLEQCTSLKDKNGRMIYEGDIVKRHSKYDEEESFVLLQVAWNNKNGRYITTDKKYDTFTFSMFYYSYEVVGNIHENSELLEGK